MRIFPFSRIITEPFTPYFSQNIMEKTSSSSTCHLIINITLINVE